MLSDEQKEYYSHADMAWAFGVRLKWTPWPPEDDDHEHCLICWQTIARTDYEPGSLDHAYRIEEFDRWICPDCASEHQEFFDWTIEPRSS